MRLVIFFWILGLLSFGQTTLAADQPWKIFILAGQSNMQGHAAVRTFDSLADDPKTASLLKETRDEQGKPRTAQRVWVSSIGCLGDAHTDLREQKGLLTTGFGAFGPPGERIGPEYTFGLTMEKHLREPILLIKTAWGGRSLHTDFRPPSAGERKVSEQQKAEWKKRGRDVEQELASIRASTSVYYRHMIAHVKKCLKDLLRVVPGYDPKSGYALAGFIWLQGWNDMVDSSLYPDRIKPDGYAEYTELLGHLIRDVRRDLATPKLPVVVGIMGVGGLKNDDTPPQMHFRQAQIKATQAPEFQGNGKLVAVAQLAMNDAKKYPEFRGNVLALDTRDLWRDAAESPTNQGYHYNHNAETYMETGLRLGWAMVELLKPEED